MALPLSALASAEVDAALAAADRCVKCGLCLPQCPTYRQSRHEADGPRGRIALAQGLLSGSLEATPTLQARLDGCLSCRACEAACPAKVPYGEVLDTARAALATPRRTRLTRALAMVLQSPSWRALLRFGLWLLQGLAFNGPRWWRYRPQLRRRRAVQAPEVAPVALFTGCVGDIAERDVLQEAIDLLRAAGVQAAIPTTQGCCGALHQHGGMPEAAKACAHRNAMAFRDSQQVLPLASGCGAALRDLGIGSLEGASPLAPKVQDLCTALADALDRQAPVFAALPLRVGIHTACTQAHVFGAAGAVRRLLARVPELTLVDLAPETGCCGAAGTAFLTAPAQADTLLAPKLAAAAGLDVIVSANIGCTLHLQAGLRARGQNVTVRHPISLLAQALRQ